MENNMTDNITPTPAPVVAPVTPAVTKGYKTSEFWVTTVTSLVVALNSSGILGAVQIPTGIIQTLVGLAVSYILGRSIVKATA